MEATPKSRAVKKQVQIQGLRIWMHNPTVNPTEDTHAFNFSVQPTDTDTKLVEVRYRYKRKLLDRRVADLRLLCVFEVTEGDSIGRRIVTTKTAVELNKMVLLYADEILMKKSSEMFDVPLRIAPMDDETLEVAVKEMIRRTFN